MKKSAILVAGALLANVAPWQNDAGYCYLDGDVANAEEAPGLGDT